MKAIWKNTEIANSDKTVIIEGNHYFPEDSVNFDYLINSETDSYCPWKGTASYYSVVVDRETNNDAAWYYPDPKEKAKAIIGHIAFWKGVEIIE